MGNDSSWLGGNTYSGYALRTNAGKLSFYYCYGTGVREVITSTQVFDTAMWQHVAVTKQGGDITLYVNGQVVASGSFSTNNTIKSSSKTFKIGENGSADYRNFLGDIDEVKVWNVARTQTEVRADMEDLCGSVPSNLIAYYRLNDVGSATSNPIVCASNSALNGVFNGPIISHPGAVFFNGGTTTLYVDSSNTASGCGAIDGSSWQKAFPDLNTAIEIAQTNLQINKILVAKGTYHPTNFSYDVKNSGKGCQIQSNANTNKTFDVRAGVDLLGGYPSGGAATASPAIYRTILDGAKAGGVTTDTATVVVRMYNPLNNPDTTKLAGFTVRHAVGFNGRGVYCYGSYGGAVVIENCIITRNGSSNGNAVGISGGILASLLIRNDTITFNSGGGISVGGTPFRLHDNYIYGNAGTAVDVSGGGTADIRRNEIAYSTWQGYYQDGGSATIVGNHFHHNGTQGIGLMMCQASRVDSNIITHHDANISIQGCGIYVYGEGPHQIRYNTIQNNISSYGAGIFSFNAVNTIVGNIVENNHATVQGGGMWLQGGSNQVFHNVVRNNTSANNGGGIIMDNGMGGTIATVANNLIVGNTAQTSAGGLHIIATKFSVVNNLIANNVAQFDAGATLTNTVDSGGTVINNTFYNNTATDPSFFTTTGGMALNNTIRQTKVYQNIFWKNKIGTSETVAGADYRSGGSVKHLFINNAMQLAATNYTTGTGGSADIGTYASGNFFAVNPQFINESNAAGVDTILGTADDGLKLLNSSPFIDAGKNSLFPFIVTTDDVKNDTRVTGDSIDLGAYELNYLPANASSQSALHVCKGSATTLR
ncbi:MAG: type sorting protein, partial [Flavipsychrobacter sp.]|nr:type sorting protein [Flavipsychrobacter sp.]